MNLDNIHRILTQPEMEVSACKKKCWRHLVFAQRLSFFIASYLTDEHLEPTKSIQDNRSKKYPEFHIFFFFCYLLSLRVDFPVLEIKDREDHGRMTKDILGGPKSLASLYCLSSISASISSISVSVAKYRRPRYAKPNPK